MAVRCSLRVFLWALVTVVLSACGGQDPILVGFAGELTGPHADLGAAGRDGVILAVEQINKQGGINGRPIQLNYQRQPG